MSSISMDINEDNEKYVISINIQQWSEQEERAETEQFIDGKNVLKVRSRKLKGSWIKAFEKQINEYEDQEFKMLGIY